MAELITWQGRHGRTVDVPKPIQAVADFLCRLARDEPDIGTAVERHDDGCITVYVAGGKFLTFAPASVVEDCVVSGLCADATL